MQVRSFFSAFKALSKKEMHYGSYATLEQVLSYIFNHLRFFR